MRITGPTLAVVLALPPAALVQHVYFDRSGLPDLGPFLEFQPPTTGEEPRASPAVTGPLP